MSIRALSERIARCPAYVRSFCKNPDGVAAVEFAFILPIMVVLYFGCVEVSEAVSVNRKVTAVASAAGDLVAQATSIDNAEMEDIFDAAESIIIPFSSTPLKIIISSVEIDEDGVATIDWSDAQNTTEHTDGAPFALPAALALPDTTLIVAEVEYTYESVVSDFFSGSIPLDETFYLRPRRVNAVDRTP